MLIDMSSNIYYHHHYHDHHTLQLNPRDHAEKNDCTHLAAVIPFRLQRH